MSLGLLNTPHTEKDTQNSQVHRFEFGGVLPVLLLYVRPMHTCTSLSEIALNHASRFSLLLGKPSTKNLARVPSEPVCTAAFSSATIIEDGTSKPFLHVARASCDRRETSGGGREAREGGQWVQCRSNLLPRE